MNSVSPTGGTSFFKPIVESDDSTVVAKWEDHGPRRQAHQTEAELEKELIDNLAGLDGQGGQGYEYAKHIRNESALVANLRSQLERLNDVTFTDGEWNRFINEVLANANDTWEAKTARIHDETPYLLERDDGTSKNIVLIDRRRPARNYFQVINQYWADTETQKHKNRYDVTILLNGLPMVHIELKKRGVSIKQDAFPQVGRYIKSTFSSGKRLFDYVQLFVISNGTRTRYFSTTTARDGAYDFTIAWADQQNNQINDLVAFTKTFLQKRVLLNVLLKFTVLNVAGEVLVLRPYQIAAVEGILTRINTSTQNHQNGTLAGSGYIWHATGSGKTLTSFKTASLIEGAAKVLFVVDRQDLDTQTVKEYNRYEDGSVDHTKSTKKLLEHIESNKQIVVTTIQKLARFVAKYPKHPILKEHVVLIFDECHRSQFGKQHAIITHAFKNKILFGFTGTPIFGANAVKQQWTTAERFGDRIHAYTVVDAIRDGTVLKFLVEYNKAVPTAKDAPSNALLSANRISEITKYIISHFKEKTFGGRYCSIFATDSIGMAKAYYQEFQNLSSESRDPLTVAIIYSAAMSDDGEDEDEDVDNTSGLNASDKTFLRRAIEDYNAKFQTNFNADDGFAQYYADLMERIKKREIDITIVVNMLLTGFDAKKVSTLWVDKKLREHTLVQAFARTNRLDGSIKQFGHIVTFRDMEQEVNTAIARFGDRDAVSVALMQPYAFYRDDYLKMARDFTVEFAPGEKPESEQKQKDFVNEFSALTRLRATMMSFDEFYDDRAVASAISDFDLQDYQAVYLEIYEDMGGGAGAVGGTPTPIPDDVEFEIDLIKQVTINVDYILNLISGGAQDMLWKDGIMRLVESDPVLRGIKDLFVEFLSKVDQAADVVTQWQDFIADKLEVELLQVIKDLNLHEDETEKFLHNALRRGKFDTSGKEIMAILPKVSRFTGNLDEIKANAINRLRVLYERYDRAVTGVSIYTD